jgi:CheY-like chemotaxis protein
MTFVLLVEDDEFKAADVLSVVQEVAPNATITRSGSATAALRQITYNSFDFVLLDMSLPTFDLSGPGGGGSPQGQGGLEVLRLARMLGRESAFIIVTQYPDIEIDGADVSLTRAPKLLTEKFQQPVAACVLYEFDGDAWREPLRLAITKLSATHANRNHP